MASKTQLIFELSQDTVKKLSDHKEWTAFLRSASWQHKYPFKDQLLIYAQRPDATACASFEIWTDKLHRWINRGSKGIALLSDNNGHFKLNYVFDISDTNSFYGNNVRLWQYSNKHEIAVIETLESTFGELDTTSTVMDAVVSAARNAVQDNKQDYLHELNYAKENSFLEELDDFNVEVAFERLATFSVAYMILNRLGLNPDDMFSDDDFRNIIEFNTPETISILGSAASAITETTLNSIGKTIQAAEREEQLQSKKFAKKEKPLYDDNRNNTERNDNHGRSDHLQSGGRLSDPRPDHTTGQSGNRQIRDDEKDLHQAKQTGAIQQPDDNRQADRTSTGDRPDGERTTGTSYREDNRHRETARQSHTADGMGTSNEQSPTFGGGTNTFGVGTQLSLFPTEEEQKNTVRKAEQANFAYGSAFSISQQMIDEVLTSGGDTSNSIIRICIQYSKNKSSSENIAFLKKEYSMGGKGFIFDDEKVSVWWNDDGIKISHGDTAIDSARGELITWEQVDKRIGELLELGRFAPQETLDEMQGFEFKNAASAFWYMKSDVNFDDYPELRELFKSEWFDGGFPDSTEKIKELFQQPDGLSEFIKVTSNLADLYENNTNVMRFRMYNPNMVLDTLQDLQLERKSFETAEISKVQPQRFITEDEIDALLTDKKGYNIRNIRIYLYFQEQSDLKERIKFLKDEYGFSGFSNGIYHGDYSGKGLVYSRNDIMSPFAKVQMSWNNVAKRVDAMIKSGKYLSERQIAEDIPRYQQEQIQQQIHSERIKYLNNQDNLSDEEKRATLPKRLHYFVETIGRYEKNFFEQYGLEEMVDTTEIHIADVIVDNEKRSRLIECLAKIKGATTGIHERNNAYRLGNELQEFKVIHFHKVGDFHEIYGSEAVQAAEILQLTLTNKTVHGEVTEMAGIPHFRLEDYTNILNQNGYLVVGDEEEISIVADENTIVSDDSDTVSGDDTTLENDLTNSDEETPDYSELIGKEVVIDNSRFLIESISDFSGDVSMRDLTFERQTGFPISRSEKIETVLQYLEPEQEEKLTPSFEKQKHDKVPNTVVYPEIEMSQRHNFVITDDELGYGGAKEKFKNNMEAIRVLQNCESENRLATPQEQEILSCYVGWGGLPDAFDEAKSNWATEYLQLKSTLASDEYEQARASTLNAHYTSPTVIKAMYKALENMNFKQGNILEPACGTGNFMGLVPDSMAESKIYGIELDSITGRIAQQLYQKNSVAIQGFEDTMLPDSFFDVAVGNVPFGIYCRGCLIHQSKLRSQLIYGRMNDFARRGDMMPYFRASVRRELLKYILS